MMAAVTTMQTATVSARITTVSHSILEDVTDSVENTDDSLDSADNTDILDNDTESDVATTDSTALSNTAQLAKAERGKAIQVINIAWGCKNKQGCKPVSHFTHNHKYYYNQYNKMIYSSSLLFCLHLLLLPLDCKNI